MSWNAQVQHTVLYTDPDEFGEGLVDEDEWDQERENLLSETRHESNQEASLKCYREHHNYDEPEPNPYPTRQVLQFVNLTELLGGKVDKGWRPISNLLLHFYMEHLSLCKLLLWKQQHITRSSNLNISEPIRSEYSIVLEILW